MMNMCLKTSNGDTLVKLNEKIQYKMTEIKKLYR